MAEKRHPADSLALGLVLAAAGGFMDAYTFIARGGVFANAQMGNLVLLGVRAFEGDVRALHYLAPVLAFVLGVLACQALRAGQRRLRPVGWRQAVLIGEAVLLAASAFAPQSCNDAVNAGVSFACAMQVSAFRSLHGQPYATTMCTGNLRSGTEALWKGVAARDGDSLRAGGRYFAVIGCFVAGAGAGALLTEAFREVTALFPAGLLLLAGALLRDREET